MGIVVMGSESNPFYNYNYDAGGNILTIVDSVNGPQTQTFTYDNLDRLTSAAAAGGTNGLYSESYSYDPTTGNLAAKGSLNLTYADSAHPHAATGLSNGNTYAYNAAGSTVTRVIGADTYSLAYDSENRLKTVQKNGAAMAEFLYDGDGTRVQSTINGVTTKFVGEYYEVTDSVVTKYYGGSAMRKDGALSYLLSDHLGSNSLILDTIGAVVGETRYTAWGEERYSSGSVTTDYTYTGQYSNTDDFGLMYYKARWYDPVLGRFAQADTVIPDITQPQSYNRYTYSGNNPVKYIDPSGHCEIFCLVVLIGIASFAGGAAVYEFNVSGRSWYESPDDAYATFSAGMDGFVAGVGAALTLGSAAAMVPDAAMYYGANTGNKGAYVWGATQAGILPPSVATVHGNSLNSTKTQTGYEIYDIATGDVVKTGISGGKLTKNGTVLPRAASQVNKWNKEVGATQYAYRIVVRDMPDRMTALEWEKYNAYLLKEKGNSLSRHVFPRPDDWKVK